LKAINGYQDFGKISGFWEDIRILGRYPDFGKISGFWEDIRILGRYQDFGKISGFWASDSIHLIVEGICKWKFQDIEQLFFHFPGEFEIRYRYSKSNFGNN
jgi:hypothetical protein